MVFYKKYNLDNFLALYNEICTFAKISIPDFF